LIEIHLFRRALPVKLALDDGMGSAAPLVDASVAGMVEGSCGSRRDFPAGADIAAGKTSLVWGSAPAMPVPIAGRRDGWVVWSSRLLAPVAGDHSRGIPPNFMIGRPDRHGPMYDAFEPFRGCFGDTGYIASTSGALTTLLPPLRAAIESRTELCREIDLAVGLRQNGVKLTEA
jgi:hypothetical protein